MSCWSRKSSVYIPIASFQNLNRNSWFCNILSVMSDDRHQMLIEAVDETAFIETPKVWIFWKCFNFTPMNDTTVRPFHVRTGKSGKIFVASILRLSMALLGALGIYRSELCSNSSLNIYTPIISFLKFERVVVSPWGNAFQNNLHYLLWMPRGSFSIFNFRYQIFVFSSNFSVSICVADSELCQCKSVRSGKSGSTERNTGPIKNVGESGRLAVVAVACSL